MLFRKKDRTQDPCTLSCARVLHRTRVAEDPSHELSTTKRTPQHMRYKIVPHHMRYSYDDLKRHDIVCNYSNEAYGAAVTRAGHEVGAWVAPAAPTTNSSIEWSNRRPLHLMKPKPLLRAHQSSEWCSVLRRAALHAACSASARACLGGQQCPSTEQELSFLQSPRVTRGAAYRRTDSQWRRLCRWPPPPGRPPRAAMQDLHAQCARGKVRS